MPRIFVDCTQTYITGDYRGIPRVVSNIISYGSKINLENIKYNALIIEDNSFKLLPIEDLTNKKIKKTQNNKLYKYLYSVYMASAQLIISILPFTHVRKYLLSSVNEPGLLRFISKHIINPIRAFKNKNKKLEQTKPLLSIGFSDQDIILFPDSLWNYEIDLAIASVKLKGVKIIFLCHDIIPITHPSLCPSTASLFKTWIDNKITMFDGIITNSEYTKNSLIRYLNASGKKSYVNNTKFESFRLGANINNLNCANIHDNNIQNILNNEFYLTVSAIEPRKNHKELLSAFEILWQNKLDVNLVWIGKWTWHCEELRHYVLEHEELGKRLWVFDQVSDNELIDFYKHAKALIFPSIIEGFGLPVAEAMHYKLPVILSDIPIHHEVAGNDALYFELNDLLSITELIESVHKGVILLKKTDRTITKWNESIMDLTRSIIKITS